MDMMAGIQIQMSRGENATLPYMCTCSQVPLQLHSVPLLQLHYPCYSCNLSGVIKNIESKSKRIRVDLVLECTAGGNSLWRYLHCAIPVGPYIIAIRVHVLRTTYSSTYSYFSHVAYM